MSEELNLKVLGEFVAVKQIMTAKTSVIITSQARDEKDKFDFYYEVVQKGEDCKQKFEVGDHPIFGKFMEPSAFKLLEKTDKRMVSILILHESNIVAIDYDPEIKSPDNGSDNNSPILN